MSVAKLQERLDEPGPKRLLALDGGGIRGLITLGYLGQIENVLRERYGKDDLVLSDYFDLICGTSTGSIIAAGLALGWPVETLHELYMGLGDKAFQPKKSFLGPVGRLMASKFDEKPLEKMLRERLGERNLGSGDLRVGLCVIVKRADTGSVWVLGNLPKGKFYRDNKHMKLWEVVRASTAAPTYFRPQWIKDVGGGEGGVFVDGGVSMHLNPALQLLMVSNLGGFGLEWPLGEKQTLLCSVGTGAFDIRPTPASLKRYTSMHWLGFLAVQLMRDSSELNQTLLQWMSRSPTARDIDLQIGRLEEDTLGPRPLITYNRFDVDLNAEALGELGLEYSERAAKAMRAMSDVKKIHDLDRIGQIAGAEQVLPEHFPKVFDRTP